MIDYLIFTLCLVSKTELLLKFNKLSVQMTVESTKLPTKNACTIE